MYSKKIFLQKVLVFDNFTAKKAQSLLKAVRSVCLFMINMRFVALIIKISV